jgi:hypothetical protein
MAGHEMTALYLDKRRLFIDAPFVRIGASCVEPAT